MLTWQNNPAKLWTQESPILFGTPQFSWTDTRICFVISPDTIMQKIIEFRRMFTSSVSLPLPSTNPSRVVSQPYPVPDVSSVPTCFTLKVHYFLCSVFCLAFLVLLIWSRSAVLASCFVTPHNFSVMSVSCALHFGSNPARIHCTLWHTQ